MNPTLLWLLVAVSGFAATFSAMALGVGLVFMVFEHRRPFAKRLAKVSAILVAVSLAAFIVTAHPGPRLTARRGAVAADFQATRPGPGVRFAHGDAGGDTEPARPRPLGGARGPRRGPVVPARAAAARGRATNGCGSSSASGSAWGALFARLGTWVGARWADPDAGLVQHFLHGNRSILGGLAGAYAGILFAKRAPATGPRTGALFAPAVALGMAVGRVGCLLTELPGTPTGSSFGIVLPPASAAALGAPAGVLLHPSFAYEIAFHLLAFALLVRYRDRLASPRGSSRSG